jgi:hypothetical protein
MEDLLPQRHAQATQSVGLVGTPKPTFPLRFLLSLFFCILHSALPPLRIPRRNPRTFPQLPPSARFTTPRAISRNRSLPAVAGTLPSLPLRRSVATSLSAPL